MQANGSVLRNSCERSSKNYYYQSQNIKGNSKLRIICENIAKGDPNDFDKEKVSHKIVKSSWILIEHISINKHWQ